MYFINEGTVAQRNLRDLPNLGRSADKIYVSIFLLSKQVIK